MRHRVAAIGLVLAGGASGAELDISDCIAPGPTEPRLYSGLGDTHMQGGFTGPDAEMAQRFFDQGLAYVYAFNKPEAVHSFLAAAELDPGAALPYWGVALAAGPDINTTASQGCLRIALDALDRAEARGGGPLVDAMRARFGDAGGMVSVEARAYADAMGALAAESPLDHHLATLHAAALLNIARWKWWIDGRPTEEARAARAVLADVLALEPGHIGANHYFIHATEEAPDPSSALPSAHRMAALAPGAGHIVHMPSHIYRRTGDHAAATAANYAAVAADRSYIGQAPDAARYPLRYLNHNLQFLTLSLIIEGRASESLAVAEELYDNTLRFTGLAYNEMHNQTIIASRDDFFLTVPIIAVIRNRAWENALWARLKAELPGFVAKHDFPIVAAFMAYAAGLEAVDRGGADRLAELSLAFHGAVAAVPEGLSYDNNPATVILRLANLDLLARASAGLPEAAQAPFLAQMAASMEAVPALAEDAALVAGAGADPAVALFAHAAGIEDAMTYAEPPNWYVPMRLGLGAALFRAGRFDAAEAAFREGLSLRRGYGRLAFGLIEALKAQDKAVPGWLEDARAATWRNATLPLSMDDL